MTAKFTFEKDKNWRKFQLALDPKRFNAIVEKNMKRTIQLICLVLVAKVRETIKEGKFDPNAPLTILIKGDTKPLIGYRAGAQLFGAVTYKVAGLNGFVGVMKSDSNYNIAVTVHEGKEIKVTNKMRGMFMALWQASQGKLDPNKLNGAVRDLYDQMPGKWLPLKKSTTNIVIPSRPFIYDTFENPEVLALVNKQLNKALSKSFADSIK